MLDREDVEEIAKKDKSIIVALGLIDRTESDSVLAELKKEMFIQIFISGYIACELGEE